MHSSSETPPRPKLPEGLPVPVDDGACDHLAGARLPNVTLTSSWGRQVLLSGLRGLTVIYIYPMSGKEDSQLPDGWDMIPGARGCSPQSCSFRDHQSDLKRYDAAVFGLSSQSPDHLREEVERLHLPFELLSDEQLLLKKELGLPVLDVQVAGKDVYKRVTLICRDDRIEQVFYPVFPPNKSAEQVLGWLQDRFAN